MESPASFIKHFLRRLCFCFRCYIGSISLLCFLKSEAIHILINQSIEITNNIAG